MSILSPAVAYELALETGHDAVRPGGVAQRHMRVYLDHIRMFEIVERHITMRPLGAAEPPPAVTARHMHELRDVLGTVPIVVLRFPLGADRRLRHEQGPRLVWPLGLAGVKDQLVAEQREPEARDRFRVEA